MPATSAERVPRRAPGLSPRLAFGVMLATVVAMLAGASAPSPFYPVLQERIGFSPATLTAIFAVYVVTLLVTLLVTGGLSDHVGRRPVVVGGLLVLAASMVWLSVADSVTTLLVARAVQGVAAGLLLSSLSAAVVDLEPPDRPGSAPVANTVLPLAGLAVGALGAGVVIDVLGEASEVSGPAVFGSLAVLYVLLAAVVLMVPETSPRTPGWARSLVPRVSVPAPSRPAFLRAVPAIVAGWATGGLYLSLAAPLVARELGNDSHTVQGLAVAVLMASGSLGCFVVRRWPARHIALAGASSLAVGTALTLLALVAGSLVWFLLAVVVAGFGFGTAFLGVMQSLTPTVGPERRGELFAAIFTVSYLAFSVPAVVLGAVVPAVGLLTATVVYGSVVVVLASTATLLRVRT